jgi:hypothetical protein
MIRSQFISLWRRKSCVAFVAVVALTLALTRGLATPQQRVQTGLLEFVGEWGMRGENPGELAQPAGLAVDGANRVYIADRRTGLLQKFEENGVPSLASEDLSVRTAAALAVDSGGAIYVADVRGGRVWIHYPEGDVLRNFRIASQRSADPAFTFCITSEGLIIVPDPDGERLQAFNATGRLENIWRVRQWLGGEPARPTAAAVGPDDFVYVADSAAPRIAKFTGRGELVTVSQTPDGATGPLRGLGVSRNRVFVLRGVRPQLDIWSFDGKHLATLDFGNHQDDVSAASIYFAVSPDEQIFVLDPARQRVLRFRLHMPAR